ncbi:hypothetical protein DPMN_187543 [Dreissena polymorpha]|uniref:Calmodulin n=1 Tax=Dreissena polymorpha TaxID=45954 RepID=A0A9D4DRS9_DREPO|nr:hypothetical protein DPMN_187543 [Dreissena polymorpha]
MIESKLKYKENEDEILEAYQVFDNGKGFTSSDGLREIMRTLGDKMTDAEIDEMIVEAEVNRNGMINIQDFVSTICR